MEQEHELKADLRRV